jgi:Fe-S-cluster containining protein
MSLSPEEHRQMAEAGTTLMTVAEPADHDREQVPYPASWEINPGSNTPVKMILEPGSEYEPLAAGLGRYTMWGKCGNLLSSITVDGRPQCGIYEQRPQVCRDFERGGPKCNLLRMLKMVKGASQEAAISERL